MNDSLILLSAQRLADIPKELWYIFLPVTEKESEQCGINIYMFDLRKKERDEVMSIQRKYNLPLRPNETMRQTLIKLNIKKLKRK